MKKDYFIGKYISLHFTFMDRNLFEFDLLPAITINHWRIMIGIFFFKLQITYEPKLDDELWHE